MSHHFVIQYTIQYTTYPFQKKHTFISTLTKIRKNPKSTLNFSLRVLRGTVSLSYSEEAKKDKESFELSPNPAKIEYKISQPRDRLIPKKKKKRNERRSNLLGYFVSTAN